MKNGYYRKIAWNNVKKNYRFYLPRMLAETGLLACFYIALTLALDRRMSDIPGGDYIPFFMTMAAVILGLLSVVLMFYTNSFLMKQRKREFGLYNVLGMEKKHIGKVLFYESFFSDNLAILAGLGVGVLFYKGCSLLICKLLHSDVVLGFDFLTPKTLIPAGLLFLLLDLLTTLMNRISIGRMKPVDLLSSRSAGEKEPKNKILLLILGLLALGAGYTLALTTKNPTDALVTFFLAVLLVILGTYFLFIAGSTFVLKALKKKETFYYRKDRMPTVSGLLYRMKQNAVGLASIAILATGVIIMMAASTGLYAGLQGTMEKNYPQDLYLSARMATSGDFNYDTSIPAEELEAIVRQAAEKQHLTIRSVGTTTYLQVSYYMRDGVLTIPSGTVPEERSTLVDLVFLTQETYARCAGEELHLTGNEIAVCRISSRFNSVKDLRGTLTLHGETYPVVRNFATFPIKISFSSVVDTYGIVVSGKEVLDTIYRGQKEARGNGAAERSERIDVTFADRDQAAAVGTALSTSIHTGVERYVRAQQTGESRGYRFDLDTYWDSYASVIGMYGSLLFLGILLGAVCLFATALIIYYKQISEGYEDRDRFQIMEKIGMSAKEVKETVNHQVLLVFFLPLLVACVHTAFAYPLVRSVLSILMLYKDSLLLECTLISVAAFALVYVLIYTGTSRTYYKIVK